MKEKVNGTNLLVKLSLLLLILSVGVFLSACTSSSEVLATEQSTSLPVESVLPIETPTHIVVPEPTKSFSETVDVSPQSVTTFPDVSQYAWITVLSGLNRPLDLTSARDGSGRIYILEQNGRLIETTPGAQTVSVLLDIQNKVSRQGSERGLLGIALSPNFLQDRRFYLNYTDLRGDTVVSRFRFEQGSSQVDPFSEQVLLTIKQPYANHNGGGMAFGPDGYLYIGMGDGGSAGDPENHAQSLDSLLGKMLRIDVSGGDTYTIPKDNPFANGGGKSEIWAYGLRNPWRFSFDALSGDLYIGDVGQDRIEEINFLPAGASGNINFGWNYFEGSQPYQGQPPSSIAFINPVWEYTHAEGCSVTGGVVYRGTALPEFNGIYLFGDYCNGKIWGLLRDSSGVWQARTLFQIDARISSFGTDEAGEVYVIDHSGGRVLKLVKN